MDNSKRPGQVYPTSGTSLPYLLLNSLHASILILYLHCFFSFCGGSQCLYNKWRGILRLGSESRGLLGWGSLKEQVSLSRRKVPIFSPWILAYSGP